MNKRERKREGGGEEVGKREEGTSIREMNRSEWKREGVGEKEEGSEGKRENG